MDLVERFIAMRRRTRDIFTWIAPEFSEAWDARPIPLRHPLRFYEGHLAAFNANLLHAAGLLPRRPEPALSDLFARGIDPESTTQAGALRIDAWPERAWVGDYVAVVDGLMLDAVRSGERPEILLTCVEHEEMHQETLIYLLHRLDPRYKRPPARYAPPEDAPSPARKLCDVPGRRVTLGCPDSAAFGWDNEFPACTVDVPPFRLEAHKVTNGDFLAFLDAGGYADHRWWSDAGWAALEERPGRHPPFWIPRGESGDDGWLLRGLFGLRPLPLGMPVYVSFHEAEAYARWRGLRLPTEAEFHAAAFHSGPPEAGAVDYIVLESAPVGRDDAPVTAEGIVEPVGNGWEWTASVFAGLPGFRPRPYYPGYSADFFDGTHHVVKGGSPVTARPLLRPSFRNWYRDAYSYAYTTFRCAGDLNESA